MAAPSPRESPDTIVLAGPGGVPVEAWWSPGEGGAPLVLIHGAAGHRDAWGAVWSRLAPAPRWAVSLPGRPGSEGHAALSSVAELSGWLGAVLDASPFEAPPILVGHSLGGALALLMALSGRAIGGLVLVASGAKLRVAPALLEAAEKATAPMPIDMAFGARTVPAVRDAYHQASAGTPPATAFADWSACDGFDVRAQLSSLRAPTLILHGDEDVMTPARFQTFLEDEIPGATRKALNGVGHMVPWEAPAAFAEAVSTFRSSPARSA